MCSIPVGLGFKVSVPVKIFFVIYGCEQVIVGLVLSASHISIVGSTLTPVQNGVPEHCAWGGGVGVRRDGLSVLPDETLGRCLDPARSQ